MAFFRLLGVGSLINHNLMMTEREIMHRIFSMQLNDNIEPLALDVFRFQYERNHIYKKFCDALGRNTGNVKVLADIPFLPVEFFKTHRVVSFSGPENHVFRSSGTTGSDQSKHRVFDISLYERSFMQCFRLFYGDPANYCVLALLPSYLERKDSSLVYMASHLIKKSGHPYSGFYLDELGGLAGRLETLCNSNTNVLLLGVSFALLELAEKYPMPLKNIIVMETGGMKSRRREMVREELHGILCKAFQIDAIHSEYGMTELLSQAYSPGRGLFNCPPWMKVLIRDANDPLALAVAGRTGGINIIDLANLYSCSFLATKDLGKIHANGHFEVLGRFDHSDLRGCNLLLES